MDLELTDRVVLVVGGHGLIGSAVVARLRQEGAIAIPASRRTTHGIRMDATDDRSVAAGIRALIASQHRLDGLVVTAAPSARTLDPSKNSEPSQVLEALDAKAISFLRVANAAIPEMLNAGFGRVVGLAGQNAFLTGNVTGSVRNAALIVAAKNLADATAGTGVTVNTISPARVTVSPAAKVEPARGGDSRPEDTAALIAFLLSPIAGAISGESIAVGHRVRGVTNW